MATLRKTGRNYYGYFYDPSRSPQRKSVQEILGHSDPSMTQRYADLTPEVLRLAIDKTIG